MKNLFYFFTISLLLACHSEQSDNSADINDELVKNPKSEYVTEYYPSGIKKVEGKLVEGERHGKWIYYYDNGFIWSEGNFWYGKRKGYSIVYYDNGQQKLAGEYKDGKKVGNWKVWNKDGSLAQEVSLDQPISKEDSLSLNIP